MYSDDGNDDMNESVEDVFIVSDEDGIDKPGPDCDVMPDVQGYPKKR